LSFPTRIDEFPSPCATTRIIIAVHHSSFRYARVQSQAATGAIPHVGLANLLLRVLNSTHVVGNLEATDRFVYIGNNLYLSLIPGFEVIRWNDGRPRKALNEVAQTANMPALTTILRNASAFCTHNASNMDVPILAFGHFAFNYGEEVPEMLRLRVFRRHRVLLRTTETTRTIVCRILHPDLVFSLLGVCGPLVHRSNEFVFRFHLVPFRPKIGLLDLKGQQWCQQSNLCLVC